MATIGTYDPNVIEHIQLGPTDEQLLQQIKDWATQVITVAEKMTATTTLLGSYEVGRDIRNKAICSPLDFSQPFAKLMNARPTFKPRAKKPKTK